MSKLQPKPRQLLLQNKQSTSVPTTLRKSSQTKESKLRVPTPKEQCLQQPEPQLSNNYINRKIGVVDIA